MQVEGTKEAFEALISERGIYKMLGVERSTVSNWKVYLKEGKSISMDKMEEMLIKVGSKPLKETVWEIPTPSTINFKVAMADFHDELRECKIGDSITVDFSDGVSEVLVNNSLSRHAIRLGCLVERDDAKRPIVVYKFIV